MCGRVYKPTVQHDHLARLMLADHAVKLVILRKLADLVVTKTAFRAMKLPMGLDNPGHAYLHSSRYKR